MKDEDINTDSADTVIDNNIPSPASTITIHNYHFDPTITCEIEMPEGAEILSVYGSSIGNTIWARVDTSKPMEKRRIVSICTGQPIEDKDIGLYIGRIFAGGQVRHIFDASPGANNPLRHLTQELRNYIRAHVSSDLQKARTEGAYARFHVAIHGGFFNDSWEKTLSTLEQQLR